MGRQTDKLTVTFNLGEAVKLAEHLSTLVAKGTIGSCPGWARNIVVKIHRAANEQYPKECPACTRGEFPHRNCVMR